MWLSLGLEIYECVCLCVLECVGVCTVCVCEFMFMRRRVEALEGRTHTQSQRCGGGVELIAGCCSWAPQSPESLLTPGPKEPEERERRGRWRRKFNRKGGREVYKGKGKEKVRALVSGKEMKGVFFSCSCSEGGKEMKPANILLIWFSQHPNKNSNKWEHCCLRCDQVGILKVTCNLLSRQTRLILSGVGQLFLI